MEIALPQNRECRSIIRCVEFLCSSRTHFDASSWLHEHACTSISSRTSTTSPVYVDQRRSPAIRHSFMLSSYIKNRISSVEDANVISTECLLWVASNACTCIVAVRLVRDGIASIFGYSLTPSISCRIHIVVPLWHKRNEWMLCLAYQILYLQGDESEFRGKE